jgi:DNA-binding HxlR family transcriptional regulator
VHFVRRERGCCPAYEAIQILQEKWVLHIVRALLDGPRGFNELGREIGGCNPTTLTHRLNRLENLQLVHREVQSTKCNYRLTDSGRALQVVIGAIDMWAGSHLQVSEDGDGARAVLTR